MEYTYPQDVPCGSGGDAPRCRTFSGLVRPKAEGSERSGKPKQGPTYTIFPAAAELRII